MAPGPSAAAQGGQCWHGCCGGEGAEKCYTAGGCGGGGRGSGEKGRAGGSTHCGSSPLSVVAGLGPWKPSSPRDAEGGRRAGAACSAPTQTPAFSCLKKKKQQKQHDTKGCSHPAQDRSQTPSAASEPPGFTVPCSAPPAAPARSSSRHFCRAALSLFGHFLTRVLGPWGQARTNQARQPRATANPLPGSAVSHPSGAAPPAPRVLPEQKQLLLGRKRKRGRRGQPPVPRLGQPEDRWAAGHRQPHHARRHQLWCWQVLPGRGSWE